jgi:uncharacterized protein with beta-barrel porin domain
VTNGSQLQTNKHTKQIQTTNQPTKSINKQTNKSNKQTNNQPNKQTKQTNKKNKTNKTNKQTKQTNKQTKPTNQQTRFCGDLPVKKTSLAAHPERNCRNLVPNLAQHDSAWSHKDIRSR